ncbi:hypothetical protein [Deinococcus cellulosilyticus]|uniref:Uncharacterized protein n=1 Tax=Deinococcus cellulosilyticus (strain DSM 18568 / NBRC 106333 / KACC 11606 / 5516J-15) TaxID=1223518 RepID=A0A511MYJ7_DEIC1|nr:hypothetical protein [Deinococcus cellulosilyticus]GEM45639.1 hypothetical protein DC3_12740 [Deinococcus cellulosilyticus NBRC 106333 = KACC 11606]
MQKYKLPLTALLLLVTLYPLYTLLTTNDRDHTLGISILAFYLISILAPLTGFLWARTSKKNT